MKAANIVLSILILLLAAMSAVFSYFLFEKRSQLVEGWKKMATTINQSSRAMDEGSGTNVGDALTAEALSHENYAELDQKLAQLTAQSRDLVKQRDILADSLQKIGQIVEMEKSPDSKALREMTTYSTVKGDVEKGANNLVAKRDRIADAILGPVGKFKNLKLTLDKGKLRAADEGVIGEFKKCMQQFDEEHKAFEKALAEIYRQCDGQGELNFSGDDNELAGELNKGKQAVNAMRKKLDEAKRNIEELNRQIQHQLAQIAEQGNQLDSTKKTLVDVSGQLEDMRGDLGLGAGEELPVPWKPGSPETRRQAVGRVIDVSAKYGYILINLGTESTVPQQLGKKVGNISIAMDKGLEMTVSRGELEVPTAEIITKVKITKVDKACSIAEPFGDQNGTVEIGDKVWFDVK